MEIPNNVGLAGDVALVKQMERWRGSFLQWWQDAGPVLHKDSGIYLRTAVPGCSTRWSFSHVKPSGYQWGVFFSPVVSGRRIGFGDNIGQPVWHEVPQEAESALLRIVVGQADTEPAAVEQHRLLSLSAPSDYDFRNLLQISVEEGRHAWSMVYLLLKYFGTQGAAQVDELLARRAGLASAPRMLDIFNDSLEDWLSFFLFTAFADRDGKYQLGALAEGAFDPLARASRFMLHEETFHVAVGVQGVERVLLRTCALMRENSGKDVAWSGGIPLDLIQRYINQWFPRALDMLGGEISQRAEYCFAVGIKPRYRESSYATHDLSGDSLAIEVPPGKGVKACEAISTVSVPKRRALNEVLRRRYVHECEKVVGRWNNLVARERVAFTFALPDRRFNRRSGLYSGGGYDLAGRAARLECLPDLERQYLPSDDDRAFLREIMRPVQGRGRIAAWIAPPFRGCNGKGVEWDYVRR